MRIDPTPFLRAALESKLLEPPLTHSFLEGNIDRRPGIANVHLRVQDALGRVLKITLGKGLGPLRARADEFHTILPQHSPQTQFFLQTGHGDVWAQEWIEGPSIEQPVNDMAAALKTIRALDTLEHALETTAQFSSPDAWDAEYDLWRLTVLELPVWTPMEKTFLRKTLLPWLHAALCLPLPKRRWSNGDFYSDNLKLVGERAVLLDCEHGGRTHFHREDHVRFLRLSPVAHRHPGLFAGLWPETTPTWEIFFQLRQLVLEVAANTPEYLVREVPLRKASLRFAFAAAALDPAGWSESPRPIPPEFARETVQLFWKHRAGAWSETHSRRAEIRRGQPQFVAFRIPPNTESLRLDPTATARPSLIKAIGTIDAAGQYHDCLACVTAGGADLKPTPDGLHVSPHASDAQLFISLPAPATFLIAEVLVCEQ